MSKYMVGDSCFTVQNLKALQNQAIVSLRGVFSLGFKRRKCETFKREGCSTTIFLSSSLAIDIKSLTKVKVYDFVKPGKSHFFIEGENVFLHFGRSSFPSD